MPSTRFIHINIHTYTFSIWRLHWMLLRTVYVTLKVPSNAGFSCACMNSNRLTITGNTRTHARTHTANHMIVLHHLPWYLTLLYIMHVYVKIE